MTAVLRPSLRKTLANVEPGGGPPSVPIMSFNSIAPNGTLNVVVNPNAGGVGVPTSIWSRNYAYIEEPGAGSVATCELEEYLATKDSSNWRTWVDAEGVQYETCDSCVCPDKESEGRSATLKAPNHHVSILISSTRTLLTPMISSNTILVSRVPNTGRSVTQLTRYWRIVPPSAPPHAAWCG